MTHADLLIRTYRPIPPLRVWRIRRRWDDARWGWECRICRASSSGAGGTHWPRTPTWREALAEGLKHMRTVHICPFTRISNKPCTDHCTRCGGRVWVK